MKHIHWFPGHMQKSFQMMRENLQFVDIILELVDARIPNASKNPEIETLAANKKKILILNKADLADANQNQRWILHYQPFYDQVLAMNSIHPSFASDVDLAITSCMADIREKWKKRGRIFKPARAMVVGIPNVGKSTLINLMIGKKSAKASNRPGVTRGKQWLNTKTGVELLDTPGVLWPKIENQEQAKLLAITKVIKPEILDTEGLARYFISCLFILGKQGILQSRYGIKNEDFGLEELAKTKGFMLKSKEPDLLRSATFILDEFSSGRMGGISLEIADVNKK